MHNTTMWTRQHKQSISGRFIVPVLSALVISYFAFHAYHGEYGIYAKYGLAHRATTLQARLQTVSSERAHMEKQVQLLRDGSIEKDMLDEYARRELDYTRADELIIAQRPTAKN